MRVLAIGAHPDDLEIFVWGSLCAWMAAGADIALAIATDGAAGGQAPPDELRRIRRGEAEQAAASLRTVPHFLDFPDGKLMPDRATVEAAGSLVARLDPDLVVTHAPNDYHADHRALSQAVSLAASFRVPVLYCDTMGGTGFAPTHYVDVTAHAEAKRQAIMCHLSQKPEVYAARADTQAAFRAGECNGGPDARAEAFRFEPRFPFADIRALLPPAPPLRPVGSKRKG